MRPSERAPARWHALIRLVRFYGVAAVNTAWGYGVFAALVAVGLNLFAAQIAAQLLGMAFNYVSYSLGVFGRRPRSWIGFVLAYGSNYLVSLALLAIFHHLGLSAYLAGLCALIGASLINLLVLSRLVFTSRADQGSA